MGLLDKVMQFAKSPQGQKLVQQAEQAAQDPKNQKMAEAEAKKLGL